MDGADPKLILSTEDDDFHTPPDSDPFWNETAWFSFTIPERKIQGYVYPWVRANQKILGGGVWVWAFCVRSCCIGWTQSGFCTGNIPLTHISEPVVPELIPSHFLPGIDPFPTPKSHMTRGMCPVRPTCTAGR